MNKPDLTIAARRTVLCVVTLVWMLGAGMSRAQDAPPDSSAVPATYLYGNAARLQAKGVAGVRRRLARIGKRPTVRREVYTVFVVPTASGLAAPDMLRQSPTPEPAALVQEVERALVGAGLYRTVDVVFPSGQTAPLPVSNVVLDAVGTVLARYPSLQVEVGGHTDATGAETANQRLSQARAQAVQRYLVDQFALPPERLTAVGYGEAQPVASNTHLTGRALNRRVEFRVVQ